MRWALALVVLALASVVWAWPPEPFTWAKCGSSGVYCFHYEDDDGGIVKVSWWNSSSTYMSVDIRTATCLGNGPYYTSAMLRTVPDATVHGYFDDVVDQWIADMESYECAATLVDPDPEPPVGDDPLGYSCATLGNESYCYRENDDGTYDVTWVSDCGGTYSDCGLTYQEWQDTLDDFEAARDAECDVYEPVSPDDPPVACTGPDGIACEATLQQIREILGLMLQREQDADLAPSLPFPDQPGEDQTYTPPYDASSPDFEAWTAPEILEADVLALVDLIDARAAAVVSAAEGRLPFGLMSWVPDASLEGTATCDNPTWTILRTTEEIGWCDSAPETWLATTGRALSLILATFAFGFAVVRTVAWA